MFIYESHLGGVYASKEEIDWDALYCEECGDSDWWIGEAYSIDEVIKVLTTYYADFYTPEEIPIVFEDFLKECADSWFNAD